jgi:hypothetical protein
VLLDESRDNKVEAGGPPLANRGQPPSARRAGAVVREPRFL